MASSGARAEQEWVNGLDRELQEPTRELLNKLDLCAAGVAHTIEREGVDGAKRAFSGPIQHALKKEISTAGQHIDTMELAQHLRARVDAQFSPERAQETVAILIELLLSGPSSGESGS